MYLIKLKICLSFVLLSACATTGSTDPRNDNLLVSASCALTSNCDNYVEEKERDLDAERLKAREIEAEKDRAETDLNNVNNQLEALRSKLSKLDDSIVSMQRQIETEKLETKEKLAEAAKLRTELEELLALSEAVEDDVLKEIISVEDANKERIALEARRDELEVFLVSVISSE